MVANHWLKGIYIPPDYDYVGVQIGNATNGIVAPLLVHQKANAGDTVYLQRNTDTAPSGYFIRTLDAANGVISFAVDVKGNTYQTGFAQFQGIAFASLINVGAPASVWCTNCNKNTTPCTGGAGAGSWAFWNGATWNCPNF